MKLLHIGLFLIIKIHPAKAAFLAFYPLFRYTKNREGGKPMKRLYEILQQIQSTHFAKLWLFYRKHFNSDEDCLQFLYDAILFNPSSTTALPTLEQRLNQMATSEGELDETHTIPLQMLNIVQRLVSAAHDMDQIRRGQDVFKVIYLVTCAETLGELSDHKGSKLHLWKDFWANNCSCSDKKLIYSIPLLENQR